MQSAECGMKHLEFLMFDFGFKTPQSEFRNPQLVIGILAELDDHLIGACQLS
jgi:hypothetical protein